jgi:hypothetical protein
VYFTSEPADGAHITRFARFLQQAVETDAVDIVLQPGGHFRFHVAAPPSRVVEAILRFGSASPAQMRLSASGQLE